MPKCVIPDCDNPIEVLSTGTCKNCYQSILNWTKRKPGEVESRVNQLNKFLGRMHTFLPEDLVKLRPRKIRIKALPGTIRVKKGKPKGK